MNKIFYASLFGVMLTACSSNYSVQGSSSLPALDGSKLYLKAFKQGEVKNIDSCEVVHGEFHFNGYLDTVRLANLFVDEESIMPIVLEEGEIIVKITPAGPTLGGTPLNDSLYNFIDKHNQLVSEMNELGHRQNQMILEGIDEQTISEQLESEAARITAEEDQLVTNFIEENFDNVLGPGVFMMLANQFRVPILTPQMEYLLTKATDKFKNNPEIKQYCALAKEAEERMNGLNETAGVQTEAPAADSIGNSLPTAPLTNLPKP
jgi:hypothetical protein